MYVAIKKWAVGYMHKRSYVIIKNVQFDCMKHVQ
jgi:hypothetical protein